MAASPPAPGQANWAVEHATGLPEVWARVGKWRLMRVCKASRVGVKVSLGTLPGLVVCGGCSADDISRDEVWRLDPATMRWEPMPALVTARDKHACCVVRGKLVVLGGQTLDDAFISSVETLSSKQGTTFVELPPLSCGGIRGASAIPVEESESALGQVLLLGGEVPIAGRVSTGAPGRSGHRRVHTGASA
jgi:hypothetical protein